MEADPVEAGQVVEVVVDLVVEVEEAVVAVEAVVETAPSIEGTLADTTHMRNGPA